MTLRFMGITQNTFFISENIGMENIYHRDLFEIENARNLSRDELVATFVPTQSFYRLLSSKNHIVLGSRGSGKTALAKMISHDYLSKLDDEKAKEIIKAKAFIGIYVPTNMEWIGSIKNKKWLTESEAEEYFQWRLNTATCISLLITAKSCIETYVETYIEQVKIEKELIRLFTMDLKIENKDISSILELHQEIETAIFENQYFITEKRVSGKNSSSLSNVNIALNTDLFLILKRWISIISRLLKFPETTSWFLCIDEAEFLTISHHRILNSFLRSDSGNLFFKIATMPYHHHTLETVAETPIIDGHDFEYVYIDRDQLPEFDNADNSEFSKIMFEKRAKISGDKYKDLNLDDLLGISLLLNKKSEDWDEGSHMWNLLSQYASESTLKRAKKLKGQKFKDQLAYVIHGALLLREAEDLNKGHKNYEMYSGAKMITRCADGNPRRLIRIFNNLLLRIDWANVNIKNTPIIDPAIQSDVLILFSTSVLSRVQSEDRYGPKIFNFINIIGNYLKFILYEYKLQPNQVYSFTINNNISDENWAIIKNAVALGLLYPNINRTNPDQMPIKSGDFHLAYIMAPHFRLFPRRGRRVSLNTILKFDKESSRDQLDIFDII